MSHDDRFVPPFKRNHSAIQSTSPLDVQPDEDGNVFVDVDVSSLSTQLLSLIVVSLLNLAALITLIVVVARLSYR